MLYAAISSALCLTDSDQNAVENLRQLHEELVKIEVQVIEGVSDLESLKDRNAEHQDTLEAKSREVEEAMRNLRETAKQVKELQREAKEAVREAQHQPDSEELLQSFRDYSMEQLEADIDSEKARLELTQGGDSNVIKEFEDRERQIQQVENKLSEFQTKLSDYNHAIEEIRGQWEPKLDELVKRISDAFSDSFARIGCAGQVTLDKAEDEAGADGEAGGSNFGEWSIQIHVKFREHESLSLLDSHRQSGGERAVSTIFYLMALQSLSASPFRVVDEINQGMDPRNERMVHERLVDIACASSDSGDSDVGGSGGSQYFLITPKLLNGLAYKPGMTVHCINSGVLMTDYKLVDFSRATQRIKGSIMQGGRKGKGRAMAGAGSLRNGSVFA
jgi:chromosome segregation ATPase